MSNTIVIRTGPDDPERDDRDDRDERRGAAATGADAPGDDTDDSDDADGPVGLGDRFRHLLSSGEHSNPLYPRLLRLKHVHPSAWQRACLVEGMAIAGGLVALADKATSWAPLILPVAAAGVVKFHDVLAGLLPARPPRRPAQDEEPADAP